MNIGDRIVYFRKQQEITTNKLANKAGLSQSFIRDVELSNKSITIDNLSIVCDALNISLRDFFDEGDKSPETVDKELRSIIDSLSVEQKARLIDFLKLI